MWRTLRLLAEIKPVRYHEPGVPTGLTGLWTAGSPRSSLLYLYNATLEKLQAAPETSLYRQSVEALTKHRMSVVSAVEPPGYAEWKEKAAKILAEHPDGFKIANPNDDATSRIEVHNGTTFMIYSTPEDKDERYVEWDGRPELTTKVPEGLEQAVEWEPEPQLTADQIDEIETKIGGGLIEEVIAVAEGELKLVDVILKAKPWESLEEKPAEGQWSYFER